MASQTVVGTTPAARVNLLPPEIAEQQRARRVQTGLGLAVVAAAGVVALLYLAQVSKVNDAEEELALAQQQQVRLTAERARLQSVADVYAQVAAREALVRQALANDIAWSNYLNDLMLTIPDNVWLTSMVAAQGAPAGAVAPGTPRGIGSVSFSGMAFDHDDVATWLEVLARQKGYANPYFSSSTETEVGPRTLYAFSSTVTLTTEALSGRAARLLGG